MNRPISLLTAISIFALGGCETMPRGFSGEEYEDVVPFAEATVQLLGSDTIDLRDNELTFLRFHIDPDDPAIIRVRELLDRADTFRDNVVYYSVELVRISESYTSGPQKANDLADTVVRQFRPAFVNEVGSENFDAVIRNVRAQEDFLAALRALQPLILESGDFFEDLIRETEDDALPEAAQHIDAAIEEAFRIELAQFDVVYARRDDLFTGLQMIRAYRLGDRDALDEFNERGIVLDESLLLPEDPTQAELDSAKNYIIAELEKEKQILGFLRADMADYLTTRDEFNSELAEIHDGLYLARRQIVAWIRGHQALADGVRDPSQWMDTLLKVAKGVAALT